VRLFVMPGGASRYVADKLDGEGNDRIRDYVARGGFYLGICAGAYYACRRTDWRAGKWDEIRTDNELAFYPGTAVGPISSFVRETADGSDTTAQLATLRTEIGDVYPCLYWGGPIFRPDELETTASWRVLARYTEGVADGEAAVVLGSYGRGHYLLLGVHLEIDQARLDLMRFTAAAIQGLTARSIAKLMRHVSVLADGRRL
jgi:glutamine amidotransferase-like uncharacterized protein